ncbi:TPA: hypothetical protein ACUNF5_003885 [Burkholderia orbicola]|uniref:hypothetical protein n=1 Tax=Burkholderia cenocepacia TaxID=95486 RepID=UPI000F59B500|nr:hypothetical protein [Burkholderia cenocepacia]MBR8155458.1 hypothetical protein [Burkholderia cenocepacia]RQV16043.1 hypothetical protein DF030_31630 [Burkholderia cenocepacia]
MSGYVRFQMWEPFRQSLIKGHAFYVEQARKRLLSQFDDMEADADRAADEWLEQRDQYFDPDRHDPGDFCEMANDVGIEFYQLLSEMREQTRLSVVAGMFHEWEKQLRDWLVGEIRHWHRGDNTTLKVWSVDFVQITDLLESFGWRLRTTDYFRTLDACRLVVNVYKHGKGKSLDDLRTNFPEYLDDPLKNFGDTVSDGRYLDHRHLKVSDEQFQTFSDAIVAFWRDVPETVVGSQLTEVPDWFIKVLRKDHGESQQKREE